MNELSYKGYVIEACPRQLLNDKWTIEITIWKHLGSRSLDKNFEDSNTFAFAKEEEAIEHCFNFGKQIIDGQIENCTVVDL